MSKEVTTEAYLETFERSLRGLSEKEREAALDEIRSHLAEARAEGLSEREAIDRLGPPEALGRAFVAELAVDRPEADRGGWIDSLLRLIGLVTLGSIPTIVIVSVLGSVGAAFVGVGVLLFGAAALEVTVGGPDWISWDNLSPELALLVGPLMAAAGAAALYVLYRYLRFLATALVRTIPFRQPDWLKRRAGPSPRRES